MATSVSDPFGAAADPALPTVALALDPALIKRYFRRRLPLKPDGASRLRLRAIRVVRHKPGKRCLIEYDVTVTGADGRRHRQTLIGKVRARRHGTADFRLLQALWNAGFQDDSLDGTSVPRPLGFVTPCNMWLQRKVTGEAATTELLKTEGVALAHRIAEAAWKLHRADVPAERSHGMADELSILQRCLRTVAEIRPDWTMRLERLFEGCTRLAASVPAPVVCGIHRDFYADQVIVDDRRLYLVDFDLYCRGDPGLDIGNFLGHLTEQGLRCFGDPLALADREEAMEERFVALSGESVRPAVRAYAKLTLVRHVYLSTRFPERHAWTERLLELCEERLGLAARLGPAIASADSGSGR
jgi:hypothetical protein